MKKIHLAALGIGLAGLTLIDSGLGIAAALFFLYDQAKPKR